MSNPQISFREIADVIKRRKLFVILPPLITTIVCTIGAFLVPRMYESSIRILVQSSEVKNPLTTLVNAMSERSEDPLNTFDEIIFSQKSIWQLMDSLGIETRSRSEAEKRSLFVKIHDNIQTKVQPHESFTITFYSNNPVQAQRGATILAEIFIQTVAALKNQKNQLTVEFYQKKLDEFQQQLERSQRQIVSTMRSRAQSSPNGNMYLYTRLDQLEQQIRDVESKKKENEQNLNVTRLSPEGILDKSGRQALFELQRSEAPYSTDLLTLLTNYEEKLEKYTPRHPEVTKVGSQIMDLLGRIGLALQSIINKQSVQLSNLRSDRSKIMDQIMSSSIEQEQDRDNQSNYSIYQRLYNEMKMKLEEAQISLVLDKNDENKYMIIDPALVPLYPSKPSRFLIVFGGFSIGLVLGFAIAFIAEMHDTTIRTSNQVQVYQKPIIAYLPQGKKNT